jgi:type II secretory ATPase GspE/PulE/Tfp pilus assembly ATPase PilB-like protein
MFAKIKRFFSQISSKPEDTGKVDNRFDLVVKVETSSVEMDEIDIESEDIHYFLKIGLTNTLRNIAEKYDFIVVLNDRRVIVSPSVASDNDKYLGVFHELSVNLNMSGFVFYKAPKSEVYTAHVKQLALLDDLESRDNSQITEDRGQVERQIHRFINDAVDARASDIHMSLTSDQQAHIFYRIDGSIDSTPITKSKADCESYIGNIFEWSGAGKAANKNHNSDIDNDTSLVVPIIVNGERKTVEVRVHYRSLSDTDKVCAFRILNVGAKIKSFNELNVDPIAQAVLLKSIRFASGLILISGPTGAGKSTLLVSFMDNKPTNKVMHTLEDPIETVCPDLLTFQGQQSENSEDDIAGFMRTDLDIAVVGEMRNGKQVDAAMGLSRTGHLVLSTIHANDAVSQIERLNDMGITLAQLAEKNLLRLLTAQRLLPLLCGHCKVPLSDEDLSDWKVVASPASYQKLADNRNKIFKQHHKGCMHCSMTGVTERQLVLEYIVVDEDGRNFIRNGDMQGWVRHLRENNWKSMADHSWKLILEGRVDPNVADGIVPDLIVDSSLPYKYGDVDV